MAYAESGGNLRDADRGCGICAASGQGLRNDVCFFHPGQFLIEALEAKGQASMINSQLMEDCRIQVADVDRIVLKTRRIATVWVGNIVAIRIVHKDSSSKGSAEAVNVATKAADIFVDLAELELEPASLAAMCRLSSRLGHTMGDAMQWTLAAKLHEQSSVFNRKLCDQNPGARRLTVMLGGTGRRPDTDLR